MFKKKDKTIKIGTTYSHRHIANIGLDQDLALRELVNFGFSIVRLGCYWDEIEQEKGVYNFSVIRKLLDACEEAKQDVLLTVGMKSPRSPEFYLPQWVGHNVVNKLETEVLEFIRQCIENLKGYSCITHWQVENEPLDPSGPLSLAISKELLQKEAELVKKLDSRPVVLNFWGNELTKRGLLQYVASYADIVGLDIYYKVPLSDSGYWSPNDSDKKLGKIIHKYPRPVWITELQAEPWENDADFTAIENPPSINPDLMRENYERVKSWDVETVLLWGFEYWLWKKLHGDDRMWEAAKEIINSNR